MKILASLFVAVLTLAACGHRSQSYTTNVEILQTQVFGLDHDSAPTVMDLDLVYTDCPGRQRNIIRGDKTFAACAHKYRKGDNVKVDVRTEWRSDRGEWRSNIVKVGDCERTVDPKDEASYEIIELCADVNVNGITTGVHCDRTRNAELVAKCPWLKR